MFAIQRAQFLGEDHFFEPLRRFNKNLVETAELGQRHQPLNNLSAAYHPEARPNIGQGQNAVCPAMFAIMLDSLLGNRKSLGRTLEIGTGSGYPTAVMSLLASQIITTERHAELSTEADRKFKLHNLDNIRVIYCDGINQQYERPFDSIIASAALDSRQLYALREHLAVGGWIVTPHHHREHADLIAMQRITATGESQFSDKVVIQENVRFIPAVEGVSEKPSAPGSVL